MRPSRRGVALVAVLFFICIVSVLLISYLVSMRLDGRSTVNYSQAISAQEVALGALQEIQGDLQAEIAAGSSNYPSASATNWARVPFTNAAMLPVPLGFAAADYGTNSDSLPRTVLGASRAASPLYAPPAWLAKAPATRASEAWTTNASANGRTVSLNRWNAPYLLGTNVPGAFAANPPQWVYVTRSGSRALTAADVSSMRPSTALSQTNQVLGRYAFVVYEEGGLLDVNAAGFPSASAAKTNSPTVGWLNDQGAFQVVTNGLPGPGGRPSLAYADLTKIPGLFSASDVDALLNWRSSGGLAAGNSSMFAAAAIYATNGFRSFLGGDNPLLGRQDLIRYFKQNLPGDLAALPYLTTFSRALNAPSWRPKADAVNGYAYLSSAESTSLSVLSSGANKGNNPNRDLPNVWTTTAFQRSDGTQAQAGDPLLVRRFPLSRLGVLAAAGPNVAPSASAAAQIQKWFGLKWGTGGANYNYGMPCWEYVGNKASATGAIETLDQIAAEGREPNFFELLKAAILCGSLGRSPGTAAFNGGDPAYAGNYSYNNSYGQAHGALGPAGLFCDILAPNVPAWPQIADAQIIQIGANIIDQYDADSYPTAIHFPYTGVGSYDNLPLNPYGHILGPVDVFFGIENLPYFTRFFNVTLSPDAPGHTQIAGWFQPELWNPHQKPAAAAGPAPSQFRIMAAGGTTGGAFTSWLQQSSGNAEISSPVIYEGHNVGELDFTDSNTTGSAFFDHPYLLTQSTIPGVTATSPEPNNVALSNYPDYASNPFVAFWTGTADYSTMSDAGGIKGNAVSMPNPKTITFWLGYVDAAGGFHPYDAMTGVFTYFYNQITVNPAASPDPITGSVVPSKQSAGFYWRPDPRTDRFSVAFSYQNSIPVGTTARPAQGTRYMVSYSLPSAPAFTNTSSSPGAIAPYYPSDWAENLATHGAADAAEAGNCFYADPDGIVRPADGFRGDAAGNGRPQFSTAGTGSAAMGDVNDGNTQHGRRPVVLNRPFRSVGELGYAFRGEPFKSLDFFSTNSADAGLLDVFSVDDEPVLVAGKVNPNTAPAPVLQAILAGASKKETDPAYNIAAEAAPLAQAIAARLTATAPGGGDPGAGPLLDRSELVTRLSEAIQGALANAADKGNKAYAEAPVRALSDVSNTRTWNLMIDVIAQSGRMTPAASTLDDFLVEGERRFWLHIAIDRITGKVVDQQLEPVYD